MTTTAVPGPLARATAALFSDYGVVYAATLLGVVVYVTVQRSWESGASGVPAILAATTAYLVVYVSLTWLRLRHEPSTFFPTWAARQVRPASASRLRFWLLGRGSADSIWVVLTASGIGMFSAAVGVALADDLAPERTAAFVALAAVTVAWCWLGVNVAYAVHYAQVFYRDAEGRAGLEFPGTSEPTYSDFAYLAMSIGTTLGTTDVVVTSTAMRRRVSRHMKTLFAYNSVILAIVLSAILG